MPDAFDLLGLPPRFTLTDDAIARAHRAAIARAHPDVVGDDHEAARLSSLLNDAADTLRDPERRAELLLRRLGGPARGADNRLPPGFLMEVMDIREAIDAAAAAGPEGTAERARWRAWAAERREEHIAAAAALFARAAPTAPDAALPAALLTQLRELLNVWRYTERLIEQLPPDGRPNGPQTTPPHPE